MLVRAAGFFWRSLSGTTDMRSGVSILIRSFKSKAWARGPGTAENGCPHIRTFLRDLKGYQRGNRG